MRTIFAAVTLSACTQALRPATFGFNPPIAVSAVFANYADWNSYVLNDGTTAYNASATACSPMSVTRSSRCEHAGELRKVVLPEQIPSCTNLVISDALGAFDWTCDDGGGPGAVTVYSTGLKDGKGLRDLINAGALAWQVNSVTVQGAVTLSTPATVWWPNNPVVALPDNSGATDAVVSLNQAKTVYVATVNRATRGYALAAQGVSLVTVAGTSLSFTGTPSANCGSLMTLVCGGAFDFTWIEASLDDGGVTLDALASVANAGFTRVHQTTLNGAGLALSSLKGPRVTNLRANASGLSLSSVTGGVFSQLQLTQGALSLSQSNNNLFERASVSGGDDGVVLSASSSNAFQRFTVFGTRFDGVRAIGSPNANNVFGFFTIANVGGNGVNLAGGGGHIVHDVITVNSGSTGLILTGTTSLAQVATLDNGGDGLHVTAGGHKFSGALLTGGNGGTDCDVDVGATAPGIDATCAARDASVALTHVGGLTSAAALTGKRTVGGSTATYPSASDAFDFLSPYDLFTSWGLDGSAYPAADQRGRWQSGTGRIWDLSLSATNGVLRGTTGDGQTANAVPADGAACPAWLAGARSVSDVAGNITYLLNAYEVLNDRVGNEDGLCESGEICAAAPNFGAYQGDGNAAAHACVFSAGAVTGVTMQFAPVNGR